MKQLARAVITATLLAGGYAQAQVSGLYNTGVNDSNAVLAAGATDTHWTVSSFTLNAGGSGPTGSAQVIVTPPAAWPAAMAGSKWVVPPGTGAGLSPGPGVVTYTTSFTLPACVTASSVSITGQARADNQIIGMRINSTNVTGLTFPSGGHADAGPLSFSLSAPGGTVAGANTLSFIVREDTPRPDGNWNGLNVVFGASTATGSCVVDPPPGNIGNAAGNGHIGVPAVAPLGLALLGGLVGLFAALRLKRKK